MPFPICSIPKEPFSAVVTAGFLNVWDGLAAFGIGAGAGALGAATGGAAFASAGGAAFGAGGFMAGAIGGAVGTAAMMPAQNLGNAMYFGDPLMTPQEYMLGIAGGALIGGTINGATALLRGNSFWTGNMRAGKLPAPQLTSTKIEINAPRAQLVQESPKSLAGEIPGAKVPATMLEESTLPPPGRSLTLDPEMGFTRSNFRKGLINLTGNNPGDAAQAHHVFPQKYQYEFSKVGINIHNPKYGAWWTTTDHLKNAYDYNASWREFINKPYTSLDVLNKGRELMNFYKIPINF